MADIDTTEYPLFKFGIPLVGPVTLEMFREEIREQEQVEFIMPGLAGELLFAGGEDQMGVQ